MGDPKAGYFWGGNYVGERVGLTSPTRCPQKGIKSHNNTALQREENLTPPQNERMDTLQ